MKTIITGPSLTSQWYKFVKEAEHASKHNLGEDLQNYLVFMLIRFMKKSEITGSVMATEYLRGSFEVGHARSAKLQEVGDKCLLFSGFFPEQTEKKRVSPGYFVSLGKSAYFELSNSRSSKNKELYFELSKKFINLTDVLLTMRKVNFEPLFAFSLWMETNSRYAYNLLRKNDASPTILNSKISH